MDAIRALARTPDKEIDLGRAALAVARIEHPDLDVEGEIARLDALARRSGGAAARGPQATLDRLVEFLFAEEGFRGNAEAYYEARNSCLNDVLDRRLGIPITLSVLVMEVGRRVGLEIEGVGLPGHFIVGARLAGRRVFLDPFNGGAVLTLEGAEEVASRAVGRPVKLEDSHWAPCSKPQIVVRMLRNLKGIYAKGQDWDRTLAVVDRLLVLDAESGIHRRDRGTVLVRMGRLLEGAKEWERYLTRFAAAPDAEGFKDELRKVRQRLGSLN